MQLHQFLSNVWPIALTALLGLVAVYTLLPRPRRMPVLLGMACGVLALGLTGWLIIRASSFTLETLLFYVFAATAVLAGGLLVTQSNPARAALSFALVILSTCGLFLLQAAPFLMAATIIVYAGAIIVTFLFVIMLAQQEGPSDADARSREPFLATVTGFLLLGTLLYVLKLTYKPDLDRWVRSTKEHLARVEDDLKQARKGKPPDDLNGLEDRLKSFCVEYGHWWRGADQKYPHGGDRLNAAIEDAQEAVDRDKGQPAEYLEHIAEKFHLLHEAGIAARNNPLLGNREPATVAGSLSSMSGPSAGTPPEQLRHDEWGRPRMPAQNAEYLGRSLFSDYLLAVELAGMLLLVATIGAIAIAHRRPGAAPTSPARERTL